MDYHSQTVYIPGESMASQTCEVGGMKLPSDFKSESESDNELFHSNLRSSQARGSESAKKDGCNQKLPQRRRFLVCGWWVVIPIAILLVGGGVGLHFGLKGRDDEAEDDKTKTGSANIIAPTTTEDDNTSTKQAKEIKLMVSQLAAKDEEIKRKEDEIKRLDVQLKEESLAKQELVRILESIKSQLEPKPQDYGSIEQAVTDLKTAKQRAEDQAKNVNIAKNEAERILSQLKPILKEYQVDGHDSILQGARRLKEDKRQVDLTFSSFVNELKWSVPIGDGSGEFSTLRYAWYKREQQGLEVNEWLVQQAKEVNRVGHKWRSDSLRCENEKLQIQKEKKTCDGKFGQLWNNYIEKEAERKKCQIAYNRDFGLVEDRLSEFGKTRISGIDAVLAEIIGIGGNAKNFGEVINHNALKSNGIMADSGIKDVLDKIDNIHQKAKNFDQVEKDLNKTGIAIDDVVAEITSIQKKAKNFGEVINHNALKSNGITGESDIAAVLGKITSIQKKADNFGKVENALSLSSPGINEVLSEIDRLQEEASNYNGLVSKIRGNNLLTLGDTSYRCVAIVPPAPYIPKVCPTYHRIPVARHIVFGDAVKGRCDGDRWTYETPSGARWGLSDLNEAKRICNDVNMNNPPSWVKGPNRGKCTHVFHDGTMYWLANCSSNGHTHKVRADYWSWTSFEARWESVPGALSLSKTMSGQKAIPQCSDGQKAICDSTNTATCSSAGAWDLNGCRCPTLTESV